ncbi:hypothetical protein A5634_09755 [Mycobacterium asiaticum]|uniref:Uncharacterized protein n=1 Tax=Mycobacterium asiaticum TaxID=1790 RepID=A0A1A3NIR3_MYCAS|nr:hypothetical protein [Mycobacterium asiaticum]OBK21691.1 hypothetical protein A5634_09755 [Mycobacterium asiaticum]
MLDAIAIVPCAPVLVPELVGTAAAEVADLVAAAVAAAAGLPARWIAVGAGRAGSVIGPEGVGTFAGFGVDVPVRLAPQDPARQEPAVLGDWPLPALIAGWVRGQARPDGCVQVRVYPADPDPATATATATATALAYGRQLRAEIDREPDPIGVLIVADGVNTLTPQAPGGYQPEAAAAQQLLDDALARGDVDALAALPEPVLGRVAFAVLAGLAEPGPRSTKEFYRGAPYGVGYFVGVWQP